MSGAGSSLAGLLLPDASPPLPLSASNNGFAEYTFCLLLDLFSPPPPPPPAPINPPPPWQAKLPSLPSLGLANKTALHGRLCFGEALSDASGVGEK